jgi:4-amino-4-deoxy-L-arabinose transferase-like glycosyltransferase
MTRLIKAIHLTWSRTLLFIFVLALLIRGVFILTLQDGFYFVDSVAYSGAAVNLLATGELGDYNRPPAYPVFLAVIYTVFGDSIFIVRMVESVMGAFLAMLVALIGRRIGGDAVGALAGILWSIHPLGVFIAGLYYPTGLVTMLLAWGVLCFLPYSHEEVSPKRVVLAGMLWGLAALTIPVVLATIAAISLWLMAWGRANRLRLVSLLCFCSALVVVPWIIRDYYKYGQIVLLEPRTVQVLPQVFADLGLFTITTPSNAPPENKLQAIMKYPAVYAPHMLREFVYFWKLYPDRMVMANPANREKFHELDSRIVKNTIFTTNNLITAVSILSNGPLFLFATLGTAAMWLKRERRRELTFLWATILSFAVTYSLFIGKARYRIPIEPYIAILSACGMKETWDLLVERFAPKEQGEASASTSLA